MTTGSSKTTNTAAPLGRRISELKEGTSERGARTLTNLGSLIGYIWSWIRQRVVGTQPSLETAPVGKKVDQTSTYRVVGYEYDFTELRTLRSGAWWSGAKVVFFKEDQWEDGDNLVGSYECYVVENSNLSAKQLKKRFGLKYKGKHMVWGRTYKQYTATINGINQRDQSSMGYSIKRSNRARSIPWIQWRPTALYSCRSNEETLEKEAIRKTQLLPPWLDGFH